MQELERNNIFASTGKKPQRPVRFQLACFLVRYSMRGSDTMTVALQLGLGHGTVFSYCRRVSRALREIGLTALAWGDENRRQETINFIQQNYGFPNCVGIVDGTLLRLTEAPKVNGAFYYCRKKYPSVSLHSNRNASNLLIFRRSMFKQL